MNLFRSEEHARSWPEWDDSMSWTMQTVEWWAETFATPMFRARVRPDFISWVTGDEGAQAMGALRARLTPPGG